MRWRLRAMCVLTKRKSLQLVQTLSILLVFNTAPEPGKDGDYITSPSAPCQNRLRISTDRFSQHLTSRAEDLGPVLPPQ